MDQILDQIKKKIDIVEFIGRYVTLKRAGKNYKGVCPFHQEKSPSFIVSPERQIWHCFGACHDGGDVIKFLMKWENLTFFETVREFSKQLGISLKNDFEDNTWKQKEKLLTINSIAAQFFQYILQKSEYGAKAREYLNNREISPKTINIFELGYAPNSWDSLSKFLINKHYTLKELDATGLTVTNERGNQYDRFRGRLMFPIKDTRGSIIGFSGRALDTDEKSAKYVNTPETMLYHKRESLYGINLAKEAIKKEGSVILVEGEFDMITPYQKGIENIVAIKGSAVTKEQLYLIKRYTDKINLALDTDAAGEDAVRRGIEEAEQQDFEVGVIRIDFAKDPDEAVHKDYSKFIKAIKKPIPIYTFLFELLQKKYPEDNPFSKKRIADGMVPFIATVKNPVVKSYIVKQLAETLAVDQYSIEQIIRQYNIKKKAPQHFIKKIQASSPTVDRQQILEKYLLSLIFQGDHSYEMADKVFDVIDISYFSIPAYQKIVAAFFDYKKTNTSKFEINHFGQTLKTELRPVLDEIYLYATLDTGLETQHYLKICVEIKRIWLKKKIKDITLQDDLVFQDKQAEMADLNAQLKELEKLDIKLYN